MRQSWWPTGRDCVRVSWVILFVQFLVISVLVTRPCSEDPVGAVDEPHVNIHHLMGAKEERFRLRGNVTTIQGVKIDVSVNVPRHPARVLFNRVPKCGSSTLIDVITRLSEPNGFTLARSPVYMQFHAEHEQLAAFVRDIQSLPTPLIYERHIHFLDTRRYGLDRPVCINIIRDPLERLASWYYFRRYQAGHIRKMSTEQRVRTYDACVLGGHAECVEPGGDDPEEGYYKLIPFFCGQESQCRQPTEAAYNQAMYNVQEYFLVVGTLSEFPEFLEVLEFLLPDYFRGASQAYTEQADMWSKKHETTYKLPVSSEAAKIMRPKLELEYKFYHFIRKRLQRQLEEIRRCKARIQSKSQAGGS